jgi:hypothetical protein
MELCDVDAVETLVRVPAVVIDVSVSVTISVSINRRYDKIGQVFLPNEKD